MLSRRPYRLRKQDIPPYFLPVSINTPLSIRDCLLRPRFLPLENLAGYVGLPTSLAPVAPRVRSFNVVYTPCKDDLYCMLNSELLCESET